MPLPTSYLKNLSLRTFLVGPILFYASSRRCPLTGSTCNQFVYPRANPYKGKKQGTPLVVATGNCFS